MPTAVSRNQAIPRSQDGGAHTERPAGRRIVESSPTRSGPADRRPLRRARQARRPVLRTTDRRPLRQARRARRPVLRTTDRRPLRRARRARRPVLRTTDRRPLRQARRARRPVLRAVGWCIAAQPEPVEMPTAVSRNQAIPRSQDGSIPHRTPAGRRVVESSPTRTGRQIAGHFGRRQARRPRPTRGDGPGRPILQETGQGPSYERRRARRPVPRATAPPALNSHRGISPGGSLRTPRQVKGGST